MHKDTGRCPGCWEVMARSVVLGVASSDLAVMDKSRHLPASLPLPGKQPKHPQQSALPPSNPLLLSRACCQRVAEETQHIGRLQGLRK